MEWEEMMKMERTVSEVNDWCHRPTNVYTTDGKALVSKVSTGRHDLRSAVREAVGSIGGVRRALSPGDRVMLKFNFNSVDPFPASSDLAFMREAVELLHDEGIRDLTISERCGWPSLPVSSVFQKKGVYEFAREFGVRIVDFEAGPFMAVRPGPRALWWKQIVLHTSLKEFDKIVYLPCMKHHRLAGFTMSLKLAVGLTHPQEMAFMHADQKFGKLDEPMYLKMLELNLPIQPDLIIMDGRKAFVTQGPGMGEVVEPEVIFASGDQIALDAEGLKVLKSYPRDNLIQMPVWENPVIARAVEMGLGARGEDDYRVLVRD